MQVSAAILQQHGVHLSADEIINELLRRVAAKLEEGIPSLAAAELLGVEPSSCVAVENSVSGTTSAQAAGMEVVVVPGVAQPSAAAGRHFVTSLEAVTVESLRNILRS